MDAALRDLGGGYVFGAGCAALFGGTTIIRRAHLLHPLQLVENGGGLIYRTSIRPRRSGGAAGPNIRADFYQSAQQDINYIVESPIDRGFRRLI